MDEVKIVPNAAQTTEDGGSGAPVPVTDGGQKQVLMPRPGSNEPLKNNSIPENFDIDAYDSILRLVVGSILGTSNLLVKQLKGLEANQATIKREEANSRVIPGDPDQNLGRHALLGLVFKSAENTRKGADIALRAAGVATRLGLAPLTALGRTRLFRPFSRGFNHMVERGEKEIQELAKIGRDEEQRSHKLVEGTVSSLVEEIPQAAQVDELVHIMVQNVIDYLKQNPEIIQSMVRSQGDIYIDYLHDHPEPIQELVQGQSMTIVGELQDGVREQLVTGDNVLELFARSIFRRTPREELPEPPPEVKAKAVRKRIVLTREKISKRG